MTRTSPATAKLQRWIDIVAALLSRNAPITFDQLAADVPAYASQLLEVAEAKDRNDRKRAATVRQSLKRTFERDKDELRRTGVPFETLAAKDAGEEGRYRIRRSDFYLPYLCLAAPDGRRVVPKRTAHYGYRALGELTFTAEELQAVVDAGVALRELADPLLLAAAQSALRKLAVDLPFDAAPPGSDEPRLARTRAGADPSTFTTLADALRHRKAVSFTYRSLSSTSTGEREVEPWGLFFLGGHWYLVANDRSRSAQRNFRLNRMSALSVNEREPGSPDYDIPTGFDVRVHARARHAWELGDAAHEDVVVTFSGDDGASLAARSSGSDVAADEEGNARRFAVRRPDAFIRWLLSFAGAATPASGAIATGLRQALLETNRLYEPSRVPLPAPHPSPPLSQPTRIAFQAATAAEQFQRLLAVVPLIVDGSPHPIDEIAGRIGASVEALQKDLFSLVERYDVPGGFIEGVQLYIDQTGITANTNHFHRPMRLTLPELCALELGLAMLAARRPPDEQGPVNTARDRLRQVIARLPGEALPNGIQDMAIAPLALSDTVATLRRCLRERRVVRIDYRRSGSPTTVSRHVRPRALLLASGALYLIAWCEERQALRHFRLDRIASATPVPRTFVPDESLDIDAIAASGRAFTSIASVTMRVRCSARVAPWIAEREGRQLEPDGTLVLDHPLADPEWGLRHVLQYGAGAEVLSPPEMRERMRGRIDAMLRRLDSVAVP